MANPHVGDIGTAFGVEITEDGSAVDVSGATTKTIKLRPPTGATQEKTASFRTDGTDGIIEWATTLATDLSIAGRWSIQGYIESPTWSGHTEIDHFTVEPNL